MTYAELVAQIQSYTENEYSTVDVNTFITQAENRIFNSVNLPDLRKNDTGTISLGNKYLGIGNIYFILIYNKLFLSFSE